MPTGTTKIILTGENARAVKAINEVGTASEKAAAKSSSAFDKSTSKVGGAFQKLDRTLGSFGIPFTGALGAMGTKLESTGNKSKGLKDNLSALGGGIALGAAAGFALIGGAAVKAALEGEKAHAQLVVAIKNAGQTEEQFGSKIDATSKHMADFGFENDDVEKSIARLIPVTKDTAKAIELQGLAADIAAGRHISLEEATSILVKVESGHVGALGRLGIATKDATGKTISQEEATKRLSDMYHGAAAAAADTYAGKIAALQAKAQNLVEELGNKLIPVIEKGVSATLSTVDAFDSANSATGGWLGKIALLGAAVPVGVFAFDKLSKGVKAVGGAFERVGSAIGKGLGALQKTGPAAGAGAEGLAALTGVSGPAALGVGALAAATYILGNTLPSATREAVRLAEGLLGTADAATKAQSGLKDIVGTAAAQDLKDYADQLLAGADAATLAATKSSALADANKEVNDAFTATTGASAAMAQGVNEGQQAFAATGAVVIGVTDKLDALKAKYGEAAIQSATLTEAQKKYADLLASGSKDEKALADARNAVVTASRAQAGTQTAVNAATAEGTNAAGDNADAAKEQADATKALADELKGLDDAENSLLGSQQSFKESTYAVSKAVADHTEKTLIAIKAKGKDKKANDDVTESSFALSRSVLSAGQSASKAAQDAETFRQAQLGVHNQELITTAGHNAEIAALRSLERTFPALKPEIEGYIRTLNAIPPSKRTEVSAPGAIDATRQVQSFTNAVNSASGRVVVNFDPLGRTQGPHAAGGPVVGGIPVLVGEKGPELFVPGSAGMIVPNGALGTRGGYASVTNINIYASGIGDRELGRQVVQALREYQRTRGPLNLKIAG